MTAVEKPVGTIKIEPDHFVVLEDGRLPIYQTRFLPIGSNGGFTSFLLTKRGVESGRALTEVSRQLGVEPSRISVHGRKDACAVTTQYLVVAGCFTPSFIHDRIWLYQLGPADGRLRLGGHGANHFTIVVQTDLTTDPVAPPEFLNIFGPQRFGNLNPYVGKWLLEGDFEAAAAALQGHQNWPLLSGIMQEQGCTAAEALLQPAFAKDLRFLLQQWQSYLFNQLAAETSELSLPLWTLETNWVYSKWWEPADLDEEMCYLLHRKNRSPISRLVWVGAQNHRVDPHPLGWQHRFRLRPGSFATVFLESIYDLRDASRERWPVNKQTAAA
jgi:tRNA(Glu) U13 pseudouridine synthase TruD